MVANAVIVEEIKVRDMTLSLNFVMHVACSIFSFASGTWNAKSAQNAMWLSFGKRSVLNAR